MRPREWEQWCERHDGEFEPLTVTAVLGSPLLARQPFVHFDALLAFLAAHKYGYPAAAAPFSPNGSDRLDDVILPLRRHASGVWCCSALWGEDMPPSPARLSFTQRPTVEHAYLLRARNVNLAGGATRARLTRETCWAPRTMVARMIGHHRAVTRLLDRALAVGHRRNQGFGRVLEWRVTPDARAEREWLAWDGVLRRPIPHPAGVLAGVKPPYWYRAWWEPAMLAGDAL